MTAEELLFGLRARYDEQFDVPLVTKIGKEYKHVQFAGLSHPSGRYALEIADTRYVLSEILTPMSLLYAKYGNNAAFVRLEDNTEKQIIKISDKRSYTDKYNAVIPAVILELEA